MRPIDADALVIEMRKGAIAIDDAYDFGIMTHLDKALRMVEQSPTINPEDLRPKGKWEQKRDYWNMFLNVCSNCGRSEFLAPPYCAGCGAKMEE